MKGHDEKPSVATEKARAWPLLASLALVAVSAALAYSNTLSSPFVFDDHEIIESNLEVKAASLSAEAFVRASHTIYKQHLIPILSFAFNHALGGLDTVGYHLFNIAVHAMNGILLLLVVRRMLERLLPKKDSVLAALCAAMLWTLNPVQLYSVTYIVQRTNSLATMFCMLSFLLYLEGRRILQDGSRRRALALFALSAAAWLPALLCKQNAAPLPAMIAIYEFLFYRQGSLNSKWFAKASIGAAIVLALSFILAGVSVSWDFQSILGGYEKRDFTLWERLLSEPRALMLYLWRLALPLPGLIRYDMLDYPPSRGLFEPASVLPAILAMAALLFCALWTARRNPFVSFCILWYLIMLAPESSVFALELAYLYRAYMPSTMLAALLAFGAFKLAPDRKAAAAALLALSAVWGILTFSANMSWRSEEALWRSELDKAPRNVRVLESLGCALMKNGRADEAIELFDRAIRINPGAWRAYYNKGLALMDSGDFKAAEASLGEALKLYPSHPAILEAMGALMGKTGRPEEAKRLLLDARFRKDSSKAGANYNLGVLEASKGNYEMALAHFKRELEANPSDWRTHMSVAAIHAAQGRAGEAIESYTKAASFNPDSFEVQTGLGLALVNSGRVDEAAATFRKALSLKPDNPVAHKGLGTCFAMKGDLRSAEISFRKSINLAPDSAEARNNLGGILAMEGKLQEAAEEFKEALRLQPGNLDARKNLEKVRRKLGGQQ